MTFNMGWKNVKHDRIGHVGITTADDLKAKAVGALRRLQNRPTCMDLPVRELDR